MATGDVMSDYLCRRIVLFFDGTWNEDDENQPATNIVYMRERLFWGLSRRLRKAVESTEGKPGKPAEPNRDARDFDGLPETLRKKGTSGLIFDGYEYMVRYDRGVGTGAGLNVITGGAFGRGLDENVRNAYRFLAATYRPGDEIYVFGFSRGSFTARSLCGFLGAIGLLKSEHCTPENEAAAWRYYRTRPERRLSGDWARFNRPTGGGEPALVHDSKNLRVRVLGVFDTVGALGIPDDLFQKFNQARYGFHDTDISSLVDIRLHALAIDEPRHAFGPTVWTKPKFKLTNPAKSPTEQAWFAGAHADVGGGYVDWTAHGATGLSLLPLTWMLQRVKRLVQSTPPIAEMPALSPAVTPMPNAPLPFFDDDLIDDKGQMSAKVKGCVTSVQHRPWAFAALLKPANSRVINQQKLAGKPLLASSGRVAFADPICEFVHVSALTRFDKPVTTDYGRLFNIVHALTGREGPYRPQNLCNIMPYLAATYVRNRTVATPWRSIVQPILTWREIRIVDWDGHSLDPADDAQAKRAFELMPAPERLGISKMPPDMVPILDPRTASYWPSPS